VEDAGAEAAVVALDAERAVTRLQPAATMLRRHPQRQVTPAPQAVTPQRDEEPAEAAVDEVAEQEAEADAEREVMAPRQRLPRRPTPYRH
jgi:hypothetical protein